MKYYLIAGEASGDMQGAALMKELKNSDPKAEFRFFGGDLMEAEGKNLVLHYKNMAFMGIFEVLLKLRTIKNNFSLCKKDLMSYQPDVLILIDYPGFNLNMAEYASKKNIKVFYYISPKIWAWKRWRIKKIKSNVDEMFTILPFETDFYNDYHFPVHYIGNPLVDEIEKFKTNVSSRQEFCTRNNLDEKPIIALLAGSRIQEIKLILPVMIEVAEKFKEYQFVIAGVPSISESIYKDVIINHSIPVIFKQTYDLLFHSIAALVSSGTATLETALFHIPQVVLYKMKGSRFITKIFRLFIIKIKYFSLPNLILKKEAVKEFIMHDMISGNIVPELDRILSDKEYRKNMLNDYADLSKLTGRPGAAKRAAEKMVAILNSY